MVNSVSGCMFGSPGRHGGKITVNGCSGHIKQCQNACGDGGRGKPFVSEGVGDRGVETGTGDFWPRKEEGGRCRQGGRGPPLGETPVRRQWSTFAMRGWTPWGSAARGNTRERGAHGGAVDAQGGAINAWEQKEAAVRQQMVPGPLTAQPSGVLGGN
jgi:hypothetical protein